MRLLVSNFGINVPKDEGDRWLNPEGAAEKELKRRTLTNLYNQRPTWLDLAHRKLDDAVPGVALRHCIALALTYHRDKRRARAKS